MLVSGVIIDQIPKLGLYKNVFSKQMAVLWMHVVQKRPKNNVVQMF